MQEPLYFRDLTEGLRLGYNYCEKGFSFDPSAKACNPTSAEKKTLNCRSAGSV